MNPDSPSPTGGVRFLGSPAASPGAATAGADGDTTTSRTQGTLRIGLDGPNQSILSHGLAAPPPREVDTYQRMLAGLSVLAGYPVTSYRMPTATDEQVMAARGMANVGTIFVVNDNRFLICIPRSTTSPQTAPTEAPTGRVIRLGQPPNTGSGTTGSASSVTSDAPPLRVTPAARATPYTQPATEVTGIGSTSVRFLSPLPAADEMLGRLACMDIDTFRTEVRPNSREWNAFLAGIVEATRAGSEFAFTREQLSRPGLFARQDGVTCQTQALIHYINLVWPRENPPFNDPRQTANHVQNRTREHLRNDLRLGSAAVEQGILDVANAVDTIRREYGIEVSAAHIKIHELVADHTQTLQGSYMRRYAFVLATINNGRMGHATLLVPNAEPTLDCCYFRIDSMDSRPLPQPVSADQMLRWRLEGTNTDSTFLGVLRMNTASAAFGG